MLRIHRRGAHSAIHNQDIETASKVLPDSFSGRTTGLYPVDWCSIHQLGSILGDMFGHDEVPSLPRDCRAESA